jgi:drug/metabolite transporter (DMT)-like permease
VLAVALGLAASLSWGVADFLGGLKSRTLELLTVLLFSQGVGFALIVATVAARGQGAPDGTHVLYACLSGMSGIVGLAAFYRGLAVGAMTVVAPISGMAAAVPVAVGLGSGERPAAFQAAGIVIAIAGVVLASREKPAEGEPSRVATGAGLALLSAVGFGGFFVAMDAASEPDFFWASLFNRATSLGILVAVALVLRPRVAVGPGDARVLVSIGVMDIAANVLFGAASTEGLVSLVAVLASLYPVVTVLLAWVVLGERVRRVQRYGVAAVLAGVALIGAG